jgi:O-antigen/teichoic acid export membrane protein
MFREKPLLRNILLVMSGTGLAQALSFGFAPVLSRLYSPAEFGVFGSFAAGAAVLSAVATLQYSEAILLPESDETAARLFVVSCGAVLAFCVLAGMACLGIQAASRSWLVQWPLAKWLWAIPLAALIAGFNQTLTSWCVRRKAFRCTAAAQVLRAGVAAAGQTAGGLGGLGAGGLVVGGILGEILSGVAAWTWLGPGNRSELLRQVSCVNDLPRAARDYRDFPCYGMPQYLANTISQAAPVLLLVYHYGAAIGGLYAFAVRVLQTPMNFVLTSLRQVLSQRFAELQQDKHDPLPLFVQSTGALLSLAAIPAALAFAFAPGVFSIVFGADWKGAGEYARWLLVWLVPAFCNVPAVLLTRVLRLQRRLLVYDAVLLGTRITALIAGGMYLSAKATIITFSILGGMFNTYLIISIYFRLKAAADLSEPSFNSGLKGAGSLA